MSEEAPPPITSAAFEEMVMAALERLGLLGKGIEKPRAFALVHLDVSQRCSVCGLLMGHGPQAGALTHCEYCLADPNRGQSPIEGPPPPRRRTNGARRLAFARAYQSGLRTREDLSREARVNNRTAIIWREEIRAMGIAAWIEEKAS